MKSFSYKLFLKKFIWTIYNSLLKEKDDSILKLIEFFDKKINILHPRIICISN